MKQSLLASLANNKLVLLFHTQNRSFFQRLNSYKETKKCKPLKKIKYYLIYNLCKYIK